jgi:hypothetical protein
MVIAVGFSQRNKIGKMRALAKTSHHASNGTYFEGLLTRNNFPPIIPHKNAWRSILAKPILHQYFNPLAKSTAMKKRFFPLKDRQIKEFTPTAIPSSVAVGFR